MTSEVERPTERGSFSSHDNARDLDNDNIRLQRPHLPRDASRLMSQNEAIPKSHCGHERHPSRG